MVAVFLEIVVLMPRCWTERYNSLQLWTVMPQGGHSASRGQVSGGQC
jgi:hypothetical protein